ncbi:MAG: acetamidase/formamidase family protein [Candidatus Deferrimicrobiaceae bacterium]
MTRHLRVDGSRSITVDATNSHNRWFPGLDPCLEVEPGEEIVLELRDGMDGELAPEMTAESLRSISLDANHALTGPIAVGGAEPGDTLVVEILGIDTAAYGATAVIPGFGLLGDRFDRPFLVRWEIADGCARSADLPGVVIRGAPFIGTIGVAPSPALLDSAAARERAVAAAGGLALMPQAEGAAPSLEPYASTGLRTIPPRENGGNLDIPQLGVGSRLLLGVQVPGALLSLGDAHFAQGEGEACGTAIEIQATARIRVGLRKSEDSDWTPTFPAFEFAAPAGPPGRREYIATTGVGVDERGANGSLDTTTAARRAVAELVELLCATRGLTEEQAYVLTSVAADLRISEAVNVPNPLVSAILPLDVFESS